MAETHLTRRVVLAMVVITTTLFGLAGPVNAATTSTTRALETSAVFTTGTPTVAGTLKVGSTLTASTGTWSPVPTSFTYQWNRNGVPIPNNANGPTYILNAYDVGRTITVTVTGVRSGYSTASQTSTPTTAIAQGTFSAVTPTIVGTAKVGSTLSVTVGAWSPTGAIAIQWKRNGLPISSGSISSTYVVTASDLGARLTVTITVTRSGYTSTSRTSNQTASVIAGSFSAPQPWIGGSMSVGSTLTAWIGAWVPTSTVRRFQWYRDGAPISGANTSRYTLTTADAGHSITFDTEGLRAGYQPLNVSSAPRSDWTTVLQSVTVSAWSVFQSCRNVGGSYDPLDPGDVWGHGDGVWVYSSGFGDFMMIVCPIHLPGAPVAWSLTFNSAWKDDANVDFLYVACDPQGNSSSWNANLWFPHRDMSWDGENIDTPVSSMSTDGWIHFSLMSTDWASLYITSVTINYLTVL